MSGETEDRPSGWTTDTLRLALLAEIDALRTHLLAEIVALQAHTRSEIEALRIQLDERYSTQVKALEAAFAAADQAVQAALTSAEKAVVKAEVAGEKRFDADAKARTNLSDQAATFMPRAEAEVATRALESKLDAQIGRTSERFADVNSQLDRHAGVTTGSAGRDDKLFAVIGAVAGALAILLAIFALVAK